MLFGGTEIVGIASVGIASFAGQYVLQKFDKHDLAQALVTSVEISGVLFVVYKAWDAIQVLVRLFGI